MRSCGEVIRIAAPCCAALCSPAPCSAALTRGYSNSSPSDLCATSLRSEAKQSGDRNLKLVIGSAARNLIDWLPSARAAPFAIARNDATHPVIARATPEAIHCPVVDCFAIARNDATHRTKKICGNPFHPRYLRAKSKIVNLKL